jgi:hypothetical protein
MYILDDLARHELNLMLQEMERCKCRESSKRTLKYIQRLNNAAYALLQNTTDDTMQNAINAASDAKSTPGIGSISVQFRRWQEVLHGVRHYSSNVYRGIPILETCMIKFYGRKKELRLNSDKPIHGGGFNSLYVFR